MEKANCYNCQNVNEVKVSSGHNKPENKGRKYFTCANCNEFQWVENGVGVSNSGFKKVDYSKSPSKQQPIIREPVADKTDWDKISRGKVRHGVAVAFIPLIGAFPITKEVSEVMETWVEWIMNEKVNMIDEDLSDVELPSEYLAKKNKEELANSPTEQEEG